MTRTERVELIFEQRTHRFLRSVRISSAVWQARAAPGVAPVGRRSLAHLALSPRRALLALQPHAWRARAPRVSRQTPCARGTRVVGRPREGPRDAGAACGPHRLRHLSGDAAGEGPDMLRAAGLACAPRARRPSSRQTPWPARRRARACPWARSRPRRAPRPPTRRHCHSALSAPFRYARRRVAV